MNILFSDFKPPPDLSQHLDTYWIGNFNISGDADFTQNVMPNGSIELIIHLSDQHCALNKDGTEFSKSPPFTLLGLYPALYKVKFAAPVNVFGIRFHPDGFRNIFGLPPARIFSTYEDGGDVLGKDLLHFCRQISETEEIGEKIMITNKFLMKQLVKNQMDFDYTHLAMRFIRQNQGLLHFDDLTDAIPISLRQLQRGFKEQLGLTITEYMRLSRLNAINKYMLKHPSEYTGMAYDLNFADQSHFIKEFRHYAGLAPKKFSKQRESFIVNAV
jgi:AraC-like DNA-binding protein